MGQAVTLVDVQPLAKESGWSALFWQAFTRSRNPMVLLDDQRRHVEVNGAYLALLGYPRQELIGRPVYELLAHGPLASPEEWQVMLRQAQFTGLAEILCADGRLIKVEFAGHPEVVTGRRLVLFVAMRTARAGRSLPEAAPTHRDAEPRHPGLSRRELDVIRLIALGLTGPEVAAELQVEHSTIRTHVRNAMAKSGARSRAQLVARALGEGTYWR
jgi:PAS domain S-box-containing protein